MLRKIIVLALVMPLSCSLAPASEVIFDGDSTKEVIRFNNRAATFWHPSEDVRSAGKFCSGTSGYYCFIDLSQAGFIFSIPVLLNQYEWSFDGSHFRLRPTVDFELVASNANKCPESKQIGVYLENETAAQYDYFYSKSCGVYGYCYPIDNEKKCFWSRGVGISLLQSDDKMSNGIILENDQEMLILKSKLNASDRESMIVREKCLIGGNCQ